MTQRTTFAAFAAALCGLLLAPGAWAQRQDDGRDDRDGDQRFAFGVGAGVVEPDAGGEIYYTGMLRIRISDDDSRGDDDWRYDRRGDIRAYLEPEIGYWERDEVGRSESDLNVGVNAVGVVPGRVVDYFFGVGLGMHFLDATINNVDQSDEHFGGNFQVGLDVHLGRTASVFGAGRFDIIEGLDETLQGKVYMGLRFWF